MILSAVHHRRNLVVSTIVRAFKNGNLINRGSTKDVPDCHIKVDMLPFKCLHDMTTNGDNENYVLCNTSIQSLKVILLKYNTSGLATNIKYRNVTEIYRVKYCLVIPFYLPSVSVH
jgi:hypothetical protein